MFTQALTKRWAGLGAKLLHDCTIEGFECDNNAIKNIASKAEKCKTSSINDSKNELILTADAFVVACGSHSAPLLRTIGVGLPVYPGKYYSVTFRLFKPEAAPWVGLIDDQIKRAISRLGNQLRVADMIDVGRYDLTLTMPLVRARCALPARRVGDALLGVVDTRLESEGGTPNFWAGLQPTTPTNMPCTSKIVVENPWGNAGHGTLGWTHGAGSGKAQVELISGKKSALALDFYGI